MHDNAAQLVQEFIKQSEDDLADMNSDEQSKDNAISLQNGEFWDLLNVMYDRINRKPDLKPKRMYGLPRVSSRRAGRSRI